jgi:hypothetical protein
MSQHAESRAIVARSPMLSFLTGSIRQGLAMVFALLALAVDGSKGCVSLGGL